VEKSRPGWAPVQGVVQRLRRNRAVVWGCRARSITRYCPRREIREVAAITWWASVVSAFSKVFRREAKSECDIELIECPHLTIEPALRLWTKGIGPTYSGP
jgi:hypothetical protein